MSIDLMVRDDPVNRKALPSVKGTVLAHRLLERPRVVDTMWLAISAVFLLILVGVLALLYVGMLSRGLGLCLVIICGGVFFVSCALCPVTGTPSLYPDLGDLFPSWAAMVAALHRSTHQTATKNGVVRERDHDFLGVIDGTQQPVLIHQNYYTVPAMFCGATSSGKTHGIGAPLLVQHVQRRASRLVVVDLKGDKALFMGLGLAAREARLNFKWLTTTPGESTYVWNPFLDPALSALAIEQWVQILLKAMGIYIGDTYGAGYYGQIQYQRVLVALQANWPVRSFRELYEILRVPPRPSEVDLSKRDIENTYHVVANTRRLASPSALNYVPATADDPVFQGAINIATDLSQPGVTYFSAPAITDPVLAKFLGKLVLHLYTAGARIHHARRVPCLFFVDEFQELLDQDIATLIRQGRDCNAAYWMAFQTLADLRTAEKDFLATVLGNTALKVFCSCDEPLTQQVLTQSSGETTRILTSTTTTTSSDHSSTGTTRRQEVIPRLNSELLNRVSSTPGMCIVKASPGVGFTQLRYPVITRTTYHISREEFDRRRAAPWPALNRWTISASNWDQAEAEPPVAAPDPVQPEVPSEPGEQATEAPRPSLATQAVPPTGQEPERRRRGRPRRIRQPQAEAAEAPNARQQNATTAPSSSVVSDFQRIAEEMSQ